jgi:hypothetical protein
MSESKFAGTLNRLKKTNKTPSEPEPPNSLSPTPTPLTGHHRGKRSDPEWTNITILMRRNIKRDARRRLEDEGEGVDLSELIDRLLTDWLSRSGG